MMKGFARTRNWSIRVLLFGLQLCSHSPGNPEQGRDLKRAAVLERQGIDIMHLSTIQLYDTEACRDFAHNLAYRLGKRIHIRTKKFDEMHALLRTLLPKEVSAWV